MKNRFWYPRSVATSALLLVSSGLLVAQEPQISGVQVLGIQASSEVIGEELQDRIADGVAGFSFASPAGAFSIGGPGNVNPGSRSQLFHLLSNESVRRELKLGDDQYAGVKKINAEAQKRMSELFRSRVMQSDGKGPTSISVGGNELREIMEENQRVAEEAIEEILLPEQLERVRQLAYQVQVAQVGLGEALVNGKLGQEIGVYEDQKQNLTDRAAKIEAEARAAIVKIRAQARAKLFEELSPEQRKKAEELLGDYFEYEEPSLQKQLQESLKGLAKPKLEKAVQD